MIERELGNWKDFIEVMFRNKCLKAPRPIGDKKRRLNESRLLCPTPVSGCRELIPGAASAEARRISTKKQGTKKRPRMVAEIIPPITPVPTACYYPSSPRCWCGHRQYAKDKTPAKSSVSVAGAGGRRTAWRLTARVPSDSFRWRIPQSESRFSPRGR